MIGRAKGGRGRRAGRNLASLAEPTPPHWIIVAQHATGWRVTLGLLPHGEYPTVEDATQCALRLFAANRSTTILIARNPRATLRRIGRA